MKKMAITVVTTLGLLVAGVAFAQTSGKVSGTVSPVVVPQTTQTMTDAVSSSAQEGLRKKAAYEECMKSGSAEKCATEAGAKGGTAN